MDRIGVIGAFAVIQKPTIPKSIWALGFVSLLMDVSSELIHSLLMAAYADLPSVS